MSQEVLPPVVHAQLSTSDSDSEYGCYAEDANTRNAQILLRCVSPTQLGDLG